MKNAHAATIGMVLLLVAPCRAQSGTSVPTINPSQTQSSSQSNETALDQLKSLGTNPADKFDNYMMRQRLKESKGKTKAELLAEDKANAVALVATLKLSCTVTNAILIAEGTEEAGGSAIKTKTYEVACESGTGYFLVQRDPTGAPSGFTCFAAEVTRTADLAAHREPAVACGLPENAGSKVMAAAILKHAGKSCTIRDIKWRGQSTTTDFLELACEEGTGFVVQSPLPGWQGPLRVDTCSESARIGIPCRLPANDSTLVALKNALAQYKVSCDAEAVHVIGHESIKRREVVEYYCPKQQPNGLVAFLPGEGATAPFEAVDCAAAAKRQAVCTLTKPN